jgi:hypothetical protein
MLASLVAAIWMQTPAQVENLCHRVGAPRGALACAIGTGPRCIIVLPHGASAALKRHELAHCAGWRH